MPPKAKMTKNDYEVKQREWSKRLHKVILGKKYQDVHEEIFEEFKTLRNEAKAFNITTVCMVDHVAPIYDHIASHGYLPHVHQEPLIGAVNNFCMGKPVAYWKAPFDQLSRSPSPIHPPSPQSKKPPLKYTFTPMVASGPSGLKKKKKAVISDELIRSEQEDESDKESVKPHEAESIKVRKPLTDEVKSLPATDGMEQNITKCLLCVQRNHGCHVNPKATKKAAAACFECNHWRIKCSLTPTRAKKREDDRAKKGEDEDEVSKEQVPKRRKKPTQVPAGQPGQFNRECF